MWFWQYVASMMRDFGFGDSGLKCSYAGLVILRGSVPMEMERVSWALTVLFEHLLQIWLTIFLQLSVLRTWIWRRLRRQPQLWSRKRQRRRRSESPSEFRGETISPPSADNYQMAIDIFHGQVDIFWFQDSLSGGREGGYGGSKCYKCNRLLFLGHISPCLLILEMNSSCIWK